LNRLLREWFLVGLCSLAIGAGSARAQSIGDDWDSGTIKSKYNIDPWNGAWCIFGAILCQSGLQDVAIDVLDDLPNDVATRLANECRQENPCDYFKQISCASEKVNAYYGANGGQANRFGSSPCRSHARAVEELVLALGIPGTEIGLVYVWGTMVNDDGSTSNVAHIVNRVTIQWNGNAFVYILDAGWFPGVFFPYTDGTKQYHKDHGRTAPRMIPFRPDCMDQTKVKGKVSSNHGDGMGGIGMSASCSGGTWFSYVVSPTSSAEGHEGEYEVMLLHYPLAPDITTQVTINTASMASDGPKSTSVGGGSTPQDVNFTIKLPEYPSCPGSPACPSDVTGGFGGYDASGSGSGGYRP